MSRDFSRPLLTLVVSLCLAAPASAQGPAALPPPTPVPPPAQPPQVAPPALPAHLPKYKLDIDLDVAGKVARVRQTATWTNPEAVPTDRLVFNAHSRYVVPAKDNLLMAKTLEILRVQPSDSLGVTEPLLDVERVMLARSPLEPTALAFCYEGDTKTWLSVKLPKPVGPGESVTVILEWTMRVPHKVGRWGHWDGVTTLSNWVPVFAYYGKGGWGRQVPGRPRPPEDANVRWQPSPFCPWHQPFFNESGCYEVALTVAADQHVACTGHVKGCIPVVGRRKTYFVEARGVREWTVVCSNRFRVFEGTAAAGVGGSAVKVRVLAFPEHEFYAKEMVKICKKSLETYSRWLGAYPWPEFTIAECYFGWNGNECSTLVMIDQRVFNMPHVATGYVEYLVTHEVCHQWWYNLVGSNGYCETWMDESPANYFSNRMLDIENGRKANLMSYPSGFGWLPNIKRDDYRSAGMYGTIGKGENTPIVQDMEKFGHLANLFNMCYDKGGRVLGMIEDRLGETAFLDFMRGIVRKYRYRILRTSEFQAELEAYTGPTLRCASVPGADANWKAFFDRWLHGDGVSDWSVESVTLERPPSCAAELPKCLNWRRKLLLARASAPDGDVEDRCVPPGHVRLHVVVTQKADYDEPVALGIALEGRDGYPVRIPILPGAAAYSLDDHSAKITALPKAPGGGARFKVDILLPGEPTQIAVDPDQVLIDSNPANNYWHTPINWRFTPLYTFLDETDLTNAYDRWNVIAGPWLFQPTYETPWFNRSTMIGARAGLYRTQQFVGGVYTGYRTNFRDIVTGIDGQWEHLPFPKSQTGFVVERRLREFNSGDQDATRAVLWSRYVFNYSASLYMPPIHFIEAFAQYSDNFLPFPTQQAPQGIRFDRTSTLGLHYRLNLLTPYWDPENGFQFDAWYEGGIAQHPSTVGLHKLAANFSAVTSPGNFSEHVSGAPILENALGWLADTRVAVRAYGATAAPSKGEFFSMGGSELFRGFDLAQRQGSTVFVGSVEWRVPVLRRLNLDAVDHVASLRNMSAAFFYDVGDAYISGKSVGPVAHGVGVGMRADVSWFSFVERTTLRFDVAKAVNADTGVQMWFGINHPF